MRLQYTPDQTKSSDNAVCILMVVMIYRGLYFDLFLADWSIVHNYSAVNERGKEGKIRHSSPGRQVFYPSWYSWDRTCFLSPEIRASSNARSGAEDSVTRS